MEPESDLSRGNMADWSQVPNDCIPLIGTKLKVAADIFSFRGVCKLWRNFLPFPQPPWLVLAEEKDKLKSPLCHGFVGLGEQHVYELDLPEVHQARCVGSTGTWLITVDNNRMIRLLNPFSRTQIVLPSQSTFEHGMPYPDNEFTPEEHRDWLVRKLVISSPPLSSTSGSSRDCIVMAIHHNHGRLAIARPGDASWTTVETPELLAQDIVFYKGQFHTVNLYGAVMVCDIGDDLHSPKASVLMDRFQLEKVCGTKLDCSNNTYVVELLRELLLVVKLTTFFYSDGKEEEEDYKTERFEVYKLDFANKKWDEVKCLGEHSLFLGFNTSVSVLASV
ncbi:hypothetical protein IFM89_005042 [Coptis chinensis]|uniref:KIB1-4 beta-propeller domain-containing protein n=1 Tax=Coptis chinensis TaxID=261450 RepID=A0A835LLN9_9MAGN|nr:hypothetical protein IFM89_005042 [Coptis chinensis]